MPDGERRTPDDDPYIMVLRTPSSPPLDITAPISCDWRPGDVWRRVAGITMALEQVH